MGERDCNVTVTDDLDVWLDGLAGRSGVTVHRYPQADHLFIDGTGPPTPGDYAAAAHVDSTTIADVAGWVLSI
jgi:uncharacterized protein